MTLENKIAQALLKVGAVELNQMIYSHGLLVLNLQSTVITVLQCHHLLFEKKLPRD